MTQQRILAIALLIVGIGLIVFGMNASYSLADQVSNTFTGHFTQATTWYILGGIASAVIGLVMLVGSLRGKSA
jgi:hypothetical protein